MKTKYGYKPKKLRSISLEVLEQKVRAKGLEWIKLSDVGK